jgi:ubiquinone/menaquinone biosynthesis C-methylase UbiE
MTVDAPTPEQQAIDTHSSQANEFAARYAHLEDLSSCFNYSRRRLDELLERQLPPSDRGVKALDVGCGTGHQMALLRARGFEVAGIDGSEPMLEHARLNNPGCDLRRGDVSSLPFPDGAFDLVMSIEVLRYLPNPGSCVREMARVLRPGGECLVTATPLLNLNGYFVVNWVATRLRPRGLVPLKQYFASSSRALARLFEASSFQDVEVHGVYLGPINWIERLAPSILPRALSRWEDLDRRLCDRQFLREVANMFLVRATRK